MKNYKVDTKTDKVITPLEATNKKASKLRNVVIELGNLIDKPGTDIPIWFDIRINQMLELIGYIETNVYHTKRELERIKAKIDPIVYEQMEKEGLPIPEALKDGKAEHVNV